MKKTIGTFIIGAAVGYFLSKIGPLIMRALGDIEALAEEEWVEVPFLTDK